MLVAIVGHIWGVVLFPKQLVGSQECSGIPLDVFRPIFLTRNNCNNSDWAAPFFPSFVRQPAFPPRSFYHLAIKMAIKTEVCDRFLHGKVESTSPSDGSSLSSLFLPLLGYISWGGFKGH